MKVISFLENGFLFVQGSDLPSVPELYMEILLKDISLKSSVIRPEELLKGIGALVPSQDGVAVRLSWEGNSVKIVPSLGREAVPEGNLRPLPPIPPPIGEGETVSFDSFRLFNPIVHVNEHKRVSMAPFSGSVIERESQRWHGTWTGPEVMSEKGFSLAVLTPNQTIEFQSDITWESWMSYLLFLGKNDRGHARPEIEINGTVVPLDTREDLQTVNLSSLGLIPGHPYTLILRWRTSLQDLAWWQWPQISDFEGSIWTNSDTHRETEYIAVPIYIPETSRLFMDLSVSFPFVPSQVSSILSLQGDTIEYDPSTGLLSWNGHTTPIPEGKTLLRLKWQGRERELSTREGYILSFEDDPLEAGRHTVTLGPNLIFYRAS